MRSLAYRLALLLVFAVPWEAAVQVGSLGRGSKLIGAALAVVWLLSIVGRGRLREPGDFQKTLFLFTVWSGLTLLWSIDTDATVSGFRTSAQLLVLVMILWDLFDTREAVETALQAYVLGAFVTCGSIIANYLTAPEAKYPTHFRVNALGFETDGIAFIVAAAGPAAWYLAASSSSWKRSSLVRLVNYSYLPIGLFSIILTGTRGATVASIPTAIFVLWSLRTAGRTTRRVVAAAFAATIIGLLAIAPQGQLDRIGTTVTATDPGRQGSALSGRWTIWQASGQAFVEKPVGGVGLDAHRLAVAYELGQVRVLTGYEKEAHNAYLSILTETGIVGIVLFALVLLCVFASVRKLRGWEAWYWSSQLAVLAIGAMSLSLEASKSVWIFLALSVCFAAAPESAFLAARRDWSAGASSLGTSLRAQPYR